MRYVRLLSFALLLVWFHPATAQTLFHLEENKVPVAVVQVIRALDHTEVHLQAQASFKGVCWYSSGPNSPYLLAGGRRYRFLNGDGIAACPNLRGYAPREVMVLRFKPLEPQVREFSLVEGKGGEHQMIDPASSTEIFWNFLHVKLN